MIIILYSFNLFLFLITRLELCLFIKRYFSDMLLKYLSLFLESARNEPMAYLYCDRDIPISYFFFIKELNKYNNKIMGQSNIVKRYPMQKIDLEQTHKVVIINIGTSNTYI